MSDHSLQIQIALCLLLGACVSPTPPGSDERRAIDLDQGAFVPFSGIADLRGSPIPAATNQSLWQPLPVVPQQGWWFAGRGWQPIGARSNLSLQRLSGAGSVLMLDIDQRQDAAASQYRIEVVLNGSRLGILETTPGRRQYRLSPALDSLEQVNELELLFDPPLEPDDGDLPLSILRLGLEGGAAAPISQPSPAPLVMTVSGTYVIPLEVPDTAGELELTLRGTGEGMGSVRIFALSEQAGRIELGALQITAQQEVARIPVAPIAGMGVSLCLAVELPRQESSLTIEEMRFLAVESPKAPSLFVASQLEVSVRQKASPDVLLIILDAARGDRFPGWEYSRQVLPVIDELGRSAVSFRRAFAECPTTSCSIPALISGQSFLPGGQVGDGKQLADEVQTLAEHLKGLGYHTVGFSATPNNSASRNLDQGFDRFHELWGRDNPDHGPFSMSRLASQVIVDQPRDQPLFLQLHYLPPHQPYAPGEEFDRFTDPDYSGPIRPDMSLKPYSLGMQTLAAEDLEQLIGLYDGNLLLADTAVGQVLSTLKSADRFDDALIVITSDHGEAFMEHGRQGHNTTLFDEMLHIPLVFRFPGGTVPLVEVDRLASELDVVPTILGYLGVESPAGFSGIDLLRKAENPRRPRTLFFRTSHPDHPMLAARTSMWKVIAWPQHRVQMVFDLATDPDEAINRVVDYPNRFTGMGLLIRRHLTRDSVLSTGAEEFRLTEEEEEELRSLGYLD